ncbi:cysteine--tRNA ligase [Pseudobacter ginsenosidimutans]|uniref:Cysteine--tRNA ligase n=1 Tax=Pseudobacter ginsenosidimutans TaxID=661488 RepID=A0A4V2F0W8_9BACT|nr:cysteine--tRNA ligase [Pseudobacter ginsenosidimutans]QEC41625.1 cysteine--tRNA ligase [Pseudobacter ginsenosidimutans]RZS71581.1 cysteinyl-tRNA synthetase [Pseudobacter ginsenosidimutans]
MSELKVLNSYTRQKEVFTPITPGHVGMYVCGPTVSGESHLGHARPFITFDVIYRYLLHLGYKVRYVRNITDAGHFEEEGRAAEDKISSKAVLEKLEPMELVQKYTNLFHWAMLQFNNLEPSIEPTATGHIVEQIEMIKAIIEAGYAYEVNGSVYFDVKKYAEHYPYGKLSGRVLDEQLETTRELDGQDEKRDKADFALWKAAPPEHIMRWVSPWGEGFPGWHIECSAMATKYLGGQFDIHGGGMDLQFPHHESEIAQSTICNKEVPARYWLHNNMITVNGKKMGKSYNNQIKLTEMFTGTHPLLEQAYSPMTIRFFILQTHYRSTLDFGNEALQAAEKGLKRLWEAYENLQKIEIPGNDAQPDVALNKKVNDLLSEMDDNMNDDFNTAKVLANIFEIVPVVNSIKDKHIPVTALSIATLERLKKYLHDYLESIFGLRSENEADNGKLSGVLDLLIDIRKDARSRKDYATSDKIRNQLQELGILLKDEKDGSVGYTFQ